MANIDYKKLHDDIVQWTLNWFLKNGGDYAVIGISGGKDSSICAAILAEALGPQRVVGVLMPNGEQNDIEDSRRVVKALGIESIEVNIGPAYEALQTNIDMPFGPEKWLPTFTTNTPARLRMVTLYGIAAQINGRVVNTCNLSEDFVGYSTKWGDATGDFSLLGKLTKTEVVKLGETFKNLPSDLVHKTPSDGMCGKSDEDNMGFTYELLDKLIRNEPLDISEFYKSLDAINKILKMNLHPNTKKKLVVFDVYDPGFPITDPTKVFNVH